MPPLQLLRCVAVPLGGIRGEELYKSLGKADIRDGRHRTVPYAKRFGQFLS